MTCPKCGNTGEPRWVPTPVMGYLHAEVHLIRWCTLSHLECAAKPLPGMGDHLDVQCGRCHYPWTEPCKDAKP